MYSSSLLMYLIRQTFSSDSFSPYFDLVYLLLSTILCFYVLLLCCWFAVFTPWFLFPYFDVLHDPSINSKRQDQPRAPRAVYPARRRFAGNDSVQDQGHEPQQLRLQPTWNWSNCRDAPSCTITLSSYRRTHHQGPFVGYCLKL